MEIIVTAISMQEGVTEALKASDQMEWVYCINGTAAVRMKSF